ncbi:MAG: carboxymuconolactone decarboxylase family protein [Verrucomicrobiota bacterium]
MSSLFPRHQIDSAPEKSRDLLKEVEADFGMIPNLEQTLASAPPALEAYVRLWALFDETTFSPIERQVVYQTANYLNNCTYCVPWHTLLSKQAGMSPEDVEALRNNTALSDSKLETLRSFTRSLIEHRGHPPKESLGQFLAAGYTSAQAMEVVLGLAVKLISNYTNGIAETPLDKEVESLAWKNP